MIMILCMHTLNLAVYNRSIWSYGSGYHLNIMSIPEVIIELFSVIAVNLFGLISGYLMWQAKFKISRLVSLYLHTAFYSVSITLLFFLFDPKTVSFSDWIISLLAITQYWYIKSYFALLCIIPILVVIVNYLKDRIVASIIALVFISFVSTFIPGDMFCIHYGFTFVWLSVMFVIGGIIRAKESDINHEKTTLLTATIFICSLAINILLYFFVRATLKQSFQNTLLFLLNSNYAAPLITIQSISFFVLILRCKINNAITQRIIAFFGPLTLAVYLIHMQPLFMRYILENALQNLIPFGRKAISESQYSIIYLSEVGIIVFLFFSCCIIDYFRMLLFRGLKINIALQKTDVFLSLLRNENSTSKKNE